MVDDAINSFAFFLHVKATQIFEQGIDDHGTQVKKQQAGTDPKKGLFGQRRVQVFGQNGFVKKQATKQNNEKGTYQKSVTVKIVYALNKGQVDGDRNDVEWNESQDDFFDPVWLNVTVKHVSIKDKLKCGKHIEHHIILNAPKGKDQARKFNCHGNGKKGQEIA